MFFRKKELYMGSSQADFERVLSALSAYGIDYSWKVSDRSDALIGRSAARGGFGTGRLENSKLYYIYVKKSEFEKARHVINQPGPQA